MLAAGASQNFKLVFWANRKCTRDGLARGVCGQTPARFPTPPETLHERLGNADQERGRRLRPQWQCDPASAKDARERALLGLRGLAPLKTYGLTIISIITLTFC
jgi:hypothetical protein